MHRTTLSTLPWLIAAAAATFFVAAPAQAGQATAENPPAQLAPGPTNTVHEIGASTNFGLSPHAFMPLFNWKMHFPGTGRMGPLSGLFLGIDIGPNIGYGGGISGNTGLVLGYEFAPWSNLALTFSPVVHNDFHYNANNLRFSQTFGPMLRLYIDQHWVVFFEPGNVGWNVNTNFNNNGNLTNAGFSFRAGMGFAYKF